MSSLYELTGKYLQIQAVLESGDEEYPIDMLTVGEELDQKLENYGRIIKNFEADINGYDSEIKRLTELKKSRQKAIDRLKDNVLDSMRKTNRSKVSTNLFNFSIAKKGGLQPLILDGDVPPEYCVAKLEPDKAKIREAIEQDGEVLDFAHIEERGEYLRIR